MRGQEQQRQRKTGYKFRQVFCSPQPHLTNMKLVVFDCLFDDNKELSDPRVPLEAGPVFNDIHNRGQIVRAYMGGTEESYVLT